MCKAHSILSCHSTEQNCKTNQTWHQNDTVFLLQLSGIFVLLYHSSLPSIFNYFIVDSPSGKLVQIEYALAAVAAGAASVGIKGTFKVNRADQ